MQRNTLCLICMVLTVAFAGLSGAATIVQWGTSGGDSTIVAAQQSGPAMDKIYDELIPVNPAVGAGYYPTNTGRNPVFYGDHSNYTSGGGAGGNRNVEIGNSSPGDLLQLPCYINKGTSVQGMLTWLEGNFLTPASLITSFKIEVAARDAGETGTLQWLVEKNNQYYVSTQTISYTGTSFKTITIAASSLTWKAFTPFGTGGNAPGVATIAGTTTPITLYNVTAVGCYWNTTNNTTSTSDSPYYRIWASPCIRLFQADGTVNLKAYDPAPVNGANNVSVNADLSWLSTADTLSYDVYFGTTSPGTFQGNQTAATFDPGALNGGTTYYWRIDTKRASGTTTGDIWSFATESRDSAGVWSNVNDYVFAWWQDGLRSSAMVFDIQTSRYGLSFDYNNLSINTFGPIANPATEQNVLEQSNDIIQSLPDADIDCVIENNTNRYTDTGAGSSWTDCQLVESGKFFHRKWLKGLMFTSGVPSGTANLEISAWPDRINFSLYFTPVGAMTNGAIEVTIDVAGVYSNLLSNGSAQALAVSSSGAGYIFVKDDSSATLTCDSTNTKCTVRLAPGTWSAGVEKAVGITVYPVADECTSRLAAAAVSESTGISVTAAQTMPSAASLTSAYQPRYGWYKINLRNDADTNAMERVALTLQNTNPSDVEVRLNFDRAGDINYIVGISAILGDESYSPTGIPIQLSKNWHTTTPSVRYQGQWFRGLTMLTVPANTTLNLTYTKVSDRWGGMPAASHAQLSLVGYGGNQLWDESAIGAQGETITYDPDVNLGRSMIDDCRPMLVHQMSKNPPVDGGWTNNVGGCDFLAYWDAGGSKVYNSDMKTKYTRYCPNLTDVTYSGYGANGNIKISCTARLYRTDDYVRAVYDLDYKVLGSVQVNTNPNAKIGRIAFFQLGADSYNNHTFNSMARGDIGGLVEQWAPTKGGNTYSRYAQPCPANTPWFSLHEAVSRDPTAPSGAWANRGMAVRSYDAKLGGVSYTSPHYSVYGTTNGGIASANVELSVPSTITQLQPGDYVKTRIIYIIVPQFAVDYYGPNANLATALTTKQDTWQMIYREAVGNELTVTASTGTVLSRYPITIKALRNQAQFIVNGGLGYVPVTFTDLQDYRGFTLERKTASSWVPVNQSVYGNDFWQTDFDAVSGTWQITYNLPLDSPSDIPQDVEFRLAGPAVYHATAPDPANRSGDIRTNKVLSWTAGLTATSRDVYFGTDYDSVATADSSSAEFKGTITATSFTPSGLLNNTTYYWAIDEKDASNTYLGSVWSFTTGSVTDNDPPTPNPAAFASAPAAVSTTEITMTATGGTDVSGPIEYHFTETSGNPGGTGSGWTTNPVYNDTGLSPSTRYTYTVQMRDAFGNTGTASNPADATTLCNPAWSLADIVHDCVVNIDDLALLAEEWLKTSEIVWSFDMATDPVGPALFELQVREPAALNNYYVMTNDTGTGTLQVTGLGNLLLDPHVPYASGLYDTTIHYVVKSTSSNPLNLWYTMGTSANPGKQAYVGISTKVSGGVQAVEIWTGRPPGITGYAPASATGFSASAYLDITVDYDYQTDTYDWTVTDGTVTRSGTDVAYTYFDDGNGGSFTLQGKDSATGLVDQLRITIHHSDVYSVADIQPDGSVNLLDFAEIAADWLDDAAAAP